MSDGLLDIDAAARFIGVTPSELKKLADKGIIQRQKGKYHPVTLVQSYVAGIKKENNRPRTQLEIAKHLDMSERNLRDVLRNLQLDHSQVNQDEIRVAYIRDLRDKAAGRGGDEQMNLSKARAEEAMVKTATLRLDYNQKIGALIMGEDAEKALVDWARFANREIMQGFHKLVAEIQSAFNITIKTEMVESIVIPTTERIEGHAEKLGQELVASSGEFQDSQDRTDG